MTAMTTAPLPRSLDPLPGESLTGFVLRLSHRLSLSPGWLMRRTGIAGINAHGLLSSDVSLATAMSSDLTVAFATATRLTPPEVTALTLACWNGRYPSVTRVLQPYAIRRPRTTSWLFRRAARYCPQCLAGDGSPIQQRHGGAWKKLWRLPVIFICPEHQVYLQHLCPGCHQPANSGEHGRLAARVGDVGLHSAQCRNSLRVHDRAHRSDPACGTRLDQSAMPPERPSRDLLTLQHRILAMLDLRQPADDTARYFNDLKMITSLVCVTWPKARLSSPGTPAEAADQYLNRQEELITSNQRLRFLSVLPAESHATAALLHAAQNILDSPDLRAVLAPLVAENRAQTRSASWSMAFTTNADECSPHLREAAGPLVRTFRGSRTRFGRSAAGTGHRQFPPEHVPAFLRQNWFDRHFSHFTDVNPRKLRRTASVRLAQLALGGRWTRQRNSWDSPSTCPSTTPTAGPVLNLTPSLSTKPCTTSRTNSMTTRPRSTTSSDARHSRTGSSLRKHGTT